MKRFIEDEARTQVAPLPEYVDDCVFEENTVRVVDVFFDESGLGHLGFRVPIQLRPVIRLTPCGFAENLYLLLPPLGQFSRRLEREPERNFRGYA